MDKIFAVGNVTEVINAPRSLLNIEVDIWYPAVGLKCKISHMTLRELKTRAIPLAYYISGQKFAVGNSTGYIYG